MAQQSIFERTEKMLEHLNERKQPGGYTEFDLSNYEGELKKGRKKENSTTVSNQSKRK